MMSLQTDASLDSSRLTAFSKFIRLALQSLALGLAALLAIDAKVSPGAVFAASFIVGRALATNIVSLDEYRRSRGERQTMPPRNQTVTRFTPATPAVWVYWVPVWVW